MLKTKNNQKCSLNILFLTSAFNSISQRAMCELEAKGHYVSVEIATSDSIMLEAVNASNPDLIIAPMLKKAIPELIWKNHTCLVLHPGIKGDRGCSSLDWAILNKEKIWGVTILEAIDEMDAGDIWASYNFSMPENSTKSQIYNNEVNNAGMLAIHTAVENFQTANFQPEKLNYHNPGIKGRLRPFLKQKMRVINWNLDCSLDIKRKIDAADSFPGILDFFLFEQGVYLFGAHIESGPLKLQPSIKKPGTIITKRNQAICVATKDGAIWITNIKLFGKENFKLPATLALKNQLLNIAENHISLEKVTFNTYQEISFAKHNDIGVLTFNFYNGAMSTEQCFRLKKAYQYALKQDIKAIILCGGEKSWSNGIHLNVIENAEDPAEEAWKNINAINDFVLEILQSQSVLTISAINTNVGAGGVMAALAADIVIARNGIMFNPHYQTMGLYGSEYWTYSLVNKIGDTQAHKLVNECLPINVEKALDIKLIDHAIISTQQEFLDDVNKITRNIIKSPDFQKKMIKKQEKIKSINTKGIFAKHRKEELAEMHKNIFSDNLGFSQARYNFVHKVPPTRTCSAIALHREKQALVQ